MAIADSWRSEVLLLPAGFVLRHGDYLSCVAARPGVHPGFMRLFAELSCLPIWLHLIPAVYTA